MAETRYGNEIYNSSTGTWTNVYTGNTRSTPGYEPAPPSGTFSPAPVSSSASAGLENQFLPGFTPGKPSSNQSSQGQTSGNVTGAPTVPSAPSAKAETKKQEGPVSGGQKALEKYGISPATQEYMYRAYGIAPSDVSEKALMDYVKIAKQIEGKVGTATQKTEMASFNQVRLLAQGQGYQAGDVKNLLVNQTGQVVGFTTTSGKEVLTYSSLSAGPATAKPPDVVGLSIVKPPVKKPYDIRDVVTIRTPQEAVLAANIAAEGTQVSKEGFYAFIEERKAYDQKIKDMQPGGKNFGLGTKERYDYAADVVFGKDAKGVAGISKGVSNVLIGFFPSAVDIGAQAIKNTPEAAKEYNKNPAGFMAGWAVGTGQNVVAQGTGIISTAGKGFAGDPVAFGETLALGAIVALPVIKGRTGQPRIEAYSAERFGFAKGDEVPVGKNTYINLAWEKGPGARILGGVEVETSGATGAGVRLYKGLPNAPDVGLFQGGRAQSPVATEIATKFMGQYGDRLANLKGPELKAYNSLVKDYVKGAEPAERAFLTEYMTGPGKTIFAEGKQLTVETSAALAKRGPKILEEPKSVFAGAKSLQEPVAITRTTPGERVLERITNAQNADVFGSTSQRVQMGKEMGRGYEKDIDLTGRQPRLTESIQRGQTPTFRKVTAGGLAQEQAAILEPSFKPGEITAERVQGKYTGLVNRQGQGHVLDIHDYGASYEPGVNPEYVGFGLKASKPVPYKGNRYQFLGEQVVAKGESAFRPNKLGVVGEAHRAGKDLFDAWDIARFTAKETGNAALAKRASNLEAKLPKDMLEYYRSKAGADTAVQRFENAKQSARARAYTGRSFPLPTIGSIAIITSKPSAKPSSLPSLYSRSPSLPSIASRRSPSKSPSRSSLPSPYSPPSSRPSSVPSSKPPSYPSYSPPSSPPSYPSSRPPSYPPPYSPPSYRPPSYPPSSPPSSSSRSRPPSPPPPPPIFQLPRMGLPRGRPDYSRAKVKGGKQYQPSVAAKILGITARAKPRAVLGPEIRPIIIKRRKK